MSGRRCAQHRGGALAVGPDDDAVGMKEVGDAVPSRRNSGLETTSKRWRATPLRSIERVDPLVGVDGNGAFLDDDFVAGDGACDLAGDRFDVGEIGIAGLALRGSDGNEDGFAFAGCFGKVGHEANPGVAVLLKELGKIVLVDEGVPALESGDFAFVVVDTDDVVADLGEADGSNQTDISRSDDGDFDVFTHSRDVLFLIVKNNRMYGVNRRTESIAANHLESIHGHGPSNLPSGRCTRVD